VTAASSPGILRPSSPAKAGDPVSIAMSPDRNFYVYILASGVGGTLYIGVTNDLIRRVYEHKTKAAEGFTKKYDVDRLVHFEQFDDIENAIRREKRLKKWNRDWKIRLIEESNPKWDDLYSSIAVP
jgi:putative endonuclease